MIPREFFPSSELSCHCGCGLLPDIKDVERLYVVRMLLKKPMAITSSARCAEHNKASGGKPGSIHLPASLRNGISSSWGGGAFDISANKEFQMEILEKALIAGFKGFGLAKNFIHIDCADRPQITYWTY